jgi:hypothetical protein
MSVKTGIGNIRVGQFGEPAECPDLAEELARDPEFRDALQDDRFAQAVFRVLCNRTFYRYGDGRPWTAGMTDGALLAGALRRHGETESDFSWTTEFHGVWPDDRARMEAGLRAEIARLAALPHPDARQRECLEWRRRKLARLDANADVYAALHAILTRLGWRTEPPAIAARVAR